MKRAINICIALVWLANGLFCKVLNLVSRHQEIVGRILGNEHAFVLTKTIGVLEILMCCWILSGIKSKTCAVVQIAVILLMNFIEFYKVPDLLLFGRLNLIFAFLFSVAIHANQFGFPKLKPTT